MSLEPQVRFTNAEIADVLEKAAEHVRSGWTQHNVAEYVNGQRYVCGSGAVWLSVGLCIENQLDTEKDSAHLWTGLRIHTGTDDPIEAYRRQSLWCAALDRIRDYVGDQVTSWNDSIGQTQERVVDTMLRVAKELRNVETP